MTIGVNVKTILQSMSVAGEMVNGLLLTVMGDLQQNRFLKIYTMIIIMDYLRIVKKTRWKIFL